MNLTLAKPEGADFIGFGVRLRNSNTGDFMTVSNSGAVSVMGSEVTTLSATPTELTLIFRDNETSGVKNPLFIDVYVDGELVKEALEYNPNGLALGDMTRFYLLFNKSSAELSGSIYFNNLELIDGEVIPQ